MVKKITISIFITFLLFFAFYKPMSINLEGNWETKKIILDGKRIYPDELSKHILIAPEIVINNWSKSLTIPINRENFKVDFQYLDSNKPNYKIRLSSSEKSLNGIFTVKIDTTDIEVKSYTVNVEIKSNKTFISFQKHVVIQPWNPSRHKRGTPY